MLVQFLQITQTKKLQENTENATIQFFSNISETITDKRYMHHQNGPHCIPLNVTIRCINIQTSYLLLIHSILHAQCICLCKGKVLKDCIHYSSEVREHTNSSRTLSKKLPIKNMIWNVYVESPLGHGIWYINCFPRASLSNLKTKQQN